MPTSDIFVSVVVPLDNHESILEAYLLEVFTILRAQFRDYEVVLVDDGSMDGTSALVDRLIATHECLRYTRLARAFGLDVAMTAGLDAAIGDCVVFLEPGCDPPEKILPLASLCQKGSDIVIGTCGQRSHEGRMFAWGRRLFCWLCRRFVTDRLLTDTTHLMAFSRRAVNAITRIKQHHRHLSLVACSVGYATTFYPYEQRPVLRRTRRRGLLSSVQYGIATLVSNSVSPLRLATYIGALAGLANLAYMLYVCAVNLIKNQVVEGWTTLSMQMSGMFFLVFLILMVISEYLADILQKSKGTPLYHILEDRSSLRPFAGAERRNVVEESQERRHAA